MSNGRYRSVGRRVVQVEVPEQTFEKVYHFLEPDPRRDLRAHLASAIDPEQLDAAILAIDLVCWMAKQEIDGAERLAQLPQKKRAAAYRRHERARWRQLHVRHHATELAAAALKRALKNERPLVGTVGVDWKSFDEQLLIIEASARAEAEICERLQRTGRGQRMPWRDKLIALVFSLYPPDAATLRSASRAHFVRTVTQVLFLLDHHVDNVRTVIADALRRHPEPPFRLFRQPTSGIA